MAGETSPTLYDLLQVARSATTEELRAAYRRLAREHHPDIAPNGGEAMARINQAYEVLSDPERRARYDQGLASRPEPRMPGRVELPAQRAWRRRLLWMAAGGACVLLAAVAVGFGMSRQPQRSFATAPSTPATAAPAPTAAPRPSAAAHGEVTAGPGTGEGLQLIPARSIQHLPQPGQGLAGEPASAAR